jgi:hypothetical protein
MPKKQLVAEVLIDLHRRLSTLPTRSHERRMQETVAPDAQSLAGGPAFRGSTVRMR